MEILVAIALFAGVAFFMSGRRKAAPSASLRKNAVRVAVPDSAPMKVESIPRGISKPVAYDDSVFKNNKGAFSFPKYGVRAAWVRITDKTPLKEAWADLDKSERDSYGLVDFESEFSGGAIELEVANFWEALRGAKKADLGEFGNLAGHAEQLEQIWQLLSDEDSESPEGSKSSVRCVLSQSLCAALLELGAATRISLEEPANLVEWLQRKSVTELREIAKARNLAASGAKKEIALRISATPNTAELHAGVYYCEANDKFGSALDVLGVKYVERLRDQIQTWHPLYVEAVWEEAARENDGVSPPGVMSELIKAAVLAQK